MTNLPILSILTFLPLIGALFILLIRGDEELVIRNTRAVALWTSFVSFLLSVFILMRFDVEKAGFQFVERGDWLGLKGISYAMGIDGISVLFLVLTTSLIPLCILASWNNVRHRIREYMIAFLVLETFMLGVFCALDLVVFYLFFEAGLIPMFFIIGIWGGTKRIYASFKFFLYTFLGSVLMLVAVVYMIGESETSFIPALMDFHFSPNIQHYLWLAFFASFAVKLPLWPVHTWLPAAHVEAPTAGSVILAGILLKLGGYGFLRFSLPMFPLASEYFTPLIFTLSVIAILYVSLVAFAQKDMKKLIAYSSVAHMGFVMMGLFAMTEQSVQGALFQMLSHGFVSAALFLCVGIVYDRIKSRRIADYGGLVKNMPIYAFFFMLFSLANIGLPGTSGFVGEFLTIIGTFGVSNVVASLAALGVILSACYMLVLYRRVIFGRLEKEALLEIKDVNGREFMILFPLAVATILFGLAPMLIFDVTSSSVNALILHTQEAMQ